MRNLFGAIEARREIALERFIYALGMRHVGETTARALARGYGSWTAFHDACLKVAAGRPRDARGDGQSRSDRRDRDRQHRRLFRRRAQPRHRRTAHRPSDDPRCRETRGRFGGGGQDRGLYRLAGKDDPRRGQSHGRAARRQGRRLGVDRRPTMWSPVPAPARSWARPRTSAWPCSRKTSGSISWARPARRAERAIRGFATFRIRARFGSVRGQCADPNVFRRVLARYGR